MTITVTNSEALQASLKPVVQKEEVTKAAPEVKATEQNQESEESATTETEDTEAKDEAETFESKDDGAEDDSAKDKPKKKGGFQRRIDKLNAAKAAAQQEVEYWKKLALEQKSAGESSKKEPVEAKATQVDGKPNPDSFETHVEYVEALTDWKIEQRAKAQKEIEQKTQLQSEQEKLVKTYIEKRDAFAKETEDYFDVLESVDDVRLSPAIEGLLLSSENGPELAYELAKDRKEYERINTLSPLAAARELGRIESKLAASKVSQEEKPETKKLTKAPKPPAPIGSKGSHVEKSLDDPTITQAEYEARRRKQLAARSAW